MLEVVERVTSVDVAERDSRQRELVPPDALAQVQAVIVGVGAVGRQVAIQLAAVGVPHIALVDHDAVEVVNLAPQAYYEADLGRSKVAATADVVCRLNPRASLVLHDRRFSRSWWAGLKAEANRRLALFCCVDSIDTRKMIWEQTCKDLAFFVDGRMAGETLRVFVAGDPPGDTYYQSTLFSAAEAYRGSCTAKATVYIGSVIAGLMVGQFARWLRGNPVQNAFTLDLLGMDLTVDKEG